MIGFDLVKNQKKGERRSKVKDRVGFDERWSRVRDDHLQKMPASCYLRNQQTFSEPMQHKPVKQPSGQANES